MAALNFYHYTPLQLHQDAPDAQEEGTAGADARAGSGHREAPRPVSGHRRHDRRSVRCAAPEDARPLPETLGGIGLTKEITYQKK